MLLTKKPIYLSTGMSNYSEIDSAVNKIKNSGNELCLFQCTSMYPTNSSKWGLNVLEDFKNKYKCMVGFSDHSGDIYASLAAISMGAEIVEVHIVFDKNMFGPDTSSSINPGQLEQLVIGQKEIKNALKNPVDKNSISDELIDMKKLFGKSIFLSKNVKKGDEISEKNIIFKKPGVGILLSEWESIRGSLIKI